MDRIKILAVVLWLGCGMALAQGLLRPASLAPGDKVAIISPASACKEKYITGACEVLREWGYVPVVSAHAKGKHGSFSGTIAERKGDLEAALMDPEIKAILCSRGKMPHYKVAADRRNRNGKASGLLLGGNLALLNSFTASPIDMLSRYADSDVILFVEDVGESLERLNRLFYTLKVNGTLGRIKGLIVGSFSDVKYTPDFAHVYDMVESIVDGYDFPVAYGFPVGHTDANYPMPEGAWVTLTVDGNGAELAF